MAGTSPYKIAFFDVDGTLLSFDTHKMPASTKEALRQLRAAGVKLYVSTGRAHYQLPPCVGEGFEGFDGFDGFICFSGSVCEDERGVFKMTPLADDDVRRVLELNEREGRDTIYMMEDATYCTGLGEDIRAMMEHVAVHYDVEDPHQFLGNKPFYQLCVLGAAGHDAAVNEVLASAHTTRWSPDFCDVIPSASGKDTGIAAVLEHLGIAPEEAVAFGDGENDITMLKAVGMGVAMGNATPATQEVANYITTSVDEDGIYNACVELGMLPA
jgi:hypothetical protein